MQYFYYNIYLFYPQYGIDNSRNFISFENIQL